MLKNETQIPIEDFFLALGGREPVFLGHMCTLRNGQALGYCLSPHKAVNSVLNLMMIAATIC